MKRLALLTVFFTVSIIIYPQSPAWSAKARNGYGYSPSYCDAYVKSQDHNDQFTIRFVKDADIEFYYLTNKQILSKMSIIIVFDNTPVVGGISYVTSYSLQEVDQGVYKCLKDWSNGGNVFVTTDGALPINDKLIVTFFKQKSSFRVLINSSNEYTTDWYEAYFSLINSSKMITLAENYPYDKL
jgi:hypothetical protein